MNSYISDRIRYLLGQLGEDIADFEPSSVPVYQKQKSIYNKKCYVSLCFGCYKYGEHKRQNIFPAVETVVKRYDKERRWEIKSNSRDLLLVFRQFEMTFPGYAYKIRLFCDYFFTEYHKVEFHSYWVNNRLEEREYIPVKSYFTRSGQFSLPDYDEMQRPFLWGIKPFQMDGHERYEIIAQPWEEVNIWTR